MTELWKSTGMICLTEGLLVKEENNGVDILYKNVRTGADLE